MTPMDAAKSPTLDPCNTARWSRMRRALVFSAAILLTLSLAYLAFPLLSPIASPADKNALQSEHDGVTKFTRAPIALNADRCPSPHLLLDWTAADPSAEPATINCELRWRRIGDPREYVARQTITFDPANPTIDIAFADLPFQPGWTGTITALQWTLQTNGHAVALRDGATPIARGGKLATMLWQQWWQRDPIAPHTINSLLAPHVGGHSPATWLALLGLLAAFAYGSIAALRRRRLRPAALVSIALAAWIINDARWAVGQQAQLAADAWRFADLRSNERIDAVLFPSLAQIAWTARRIVPAGATYAVIGGNIAFGDSRLRYLLAPRLVQVNVDPLQPRVPLDRAAYVLVLDASLVQIDAANGTLHAAGFPPWRVEKLFETSAGILILRRVPAS